MAKQTFLRGTLILIATGMITRMLGFVNRVVIARFIGEEGVGLYMMVAPTFFLATTLTQFGLPVAISKLVAEASARGGPAENETYFSDVAYRHRDIKSHLHAAVFMLCADYVRNDADGSAHGLPASGDYARRADYRDLQRRRAVTFRAGRI